MKKEQDEVPNTNAGSRGTSSGMIDRQRREQPVSDLDQDPSKNPTVADEADRSQRVLNREAFDDLKKKAS